MKSAIDVLPTPTTTESVLPSETRWLMRSPLGRTLSCRVYRSPIGIEVWVGYDESQPPVCSLVRDSLESAYASARHLRRIALECGFTHLEQDERQR